MKFNKQELLNLACQSSNRFVKEGTLLVYERQDGILFKRTENSSEIGEKSRKSTRRKSLRSLSCYGGSMMSRASTERWCRLRGNLLFYFKSREAWSEPAGVILLDIGNIQVEPTSNDGMWSFTLVMACGGGDQRLAAFSETERDSWIEVLHMAAYSYIQAQVISLKKKLEQLQGEGVSNKQIATLNLETSEAGEVPLMELTIACDNLRCDGHGCPPSPQTCLYYLVTETMHWQQTSQTEIIENCSNPTFLVTLPLWSTMGLQPDSRLRLTVSDVRETMSRTHLVMGSSEFPVSALVRDGTVKRRMPLISPAGVQVGFVTVTAQAVVDMGSTDSVRGSSNPQSPTAQEENVTFHQHRRTLSLPPRLLMELRRPSQCWIATYFTRPVSKTYRFHSGLGGDIVVHESMMESRLNYFIPAQLLRLWISHEKDLVRELVALGEMVPNSPWQQRLLQLLERHFRRIGDYTQALESVEARPSSYFRPSTQKDKSTLQYCPVNLHLQRMWAQNNSLRKEGTFDCVTVGAFTAISHGFKGGGLLKLIRNFHTSALHVDYVLPAREAVQTACQTLRHIQGAIKLLLGAGGIQRDFTAVFKIVESLIKRARALKALLDSDFVMEALSFFDRNRLANSTLAPTLADFSLLPLRSMAERLVMDSSGISRSTFYTASEDPEPLDLIRINLEASLLALSGKLQSILKLHNRSSGNNNYQLEHAPGLAALLDKYEERLYADGSLMEGVDYLDKDSEDQQTSALEEYPVQIEKKKQKWVAELSPCLSKLLSAAQSVVKTLRLVHGVLRLREELPRSATAHALQHRRDVCFSQALTASVTALVARLCCNPIEPELMVLLSKAGLLFEIEGLLTPYRNEAGMWSDMTIAVEDLASVRFLLVPMTNASTPTTPSSPRSKRTDGIPSDFLPQIHGCRDSLQVTIPVPASVFSALPPSASKPGLLEFRIIPVFLNIGVNEQALLAEKFGDMSAVNATNQQGFERIENYYKRYQELMAEFFPGKRLNDPRMPLSTVISQLKDELATNKIQNIAVHTLAEIAVRKMKGLRVTCCKSAKDRTGMGVTLEQTNILSREFDLAAGEFPRSLLCMRSEGTRRDNTLKNVGVRKFAFNRLQLMAFPELLRAPTGTYGNVQS